MGWETLYVFIHKNCQRQPISYYSRSLGNKYLIFWSNYLCLPQEDQYVSAELGGHAGRDATDGNVASDDGGDDAEWKRSLGAVTEQ